MCELVRVGTHSGPMCCEAFANLSGHYLGLFYCVCMENPKIVPKKLTFSLLDFQLRAIASYSFSYGHL